MKPLPQSPAPLLPCCGCTEEAPTIESTLSTPDSTASPPKSPQMRSSGEGSIVSPTLPDVPAFLVSQHTPEEIFAHVLVFVGAHSTVTGIGSATRELRAEVLNSREVWYSLCKFTGKLAAFSASNEGLAKFGYEEFYDLYKVRVFVPYNFRDRQHTLLFTRTPTPSLEQPLRSNRRADSQRRTQAH